MKIEVTDDAATLLRKRGGTLTVDYIRPTGWGKVAEVSVDTNTKGKNLSPYKAMRAGEDLQVLITPTLAGLASRMRVTTRGGLRKKLSVELSDGRPQSDDSCEI